MCQFSSKKNNFNFFSPNLAKKRFWGWNFKNISPDLESAPPRYHMCRFSVKADKFFDLNLGKLTIYVHYFGSYKIEDVAES